MNAKETYIDLDELEKRAGEQEGLIVIETGLRNELKNFEDRQIVTPYFTLRVENNGRRLTLEIHGDIKSSLHNRLVVEYCKKLIQKGFRLNADDVPFPTDSELRLSVRSGRGPGNRRRFDIVYVNEKNERVGVEIKTKGDVGPNHTAEQLKAYAKAVSDKQLERVLFVVPAEEETNAREVLQILSLEWAISIETY
jgi:hypothetical protein